MARYFRKNDDNLITVVNEELSEFFTICGVEGFDPESEKWEEIEFGTEFLVENGEILCCHGNSTVEYGRGVNVEDYSKFRLSFDVSTEYASIDEVYETLSHGESPAFSGLVVWDGSNHTIYSFEDGMYEVEYTEVEFEDYCEISYENYDNDSKTLVAAWEDGTRQLYVETRSRNANEPFSYLDAVEEDDFDLLSEFRYDFNESDRYAVVESTDDGWEIVVEFGSLGEAELEKDIRSKHYDRSVFVFSVVKWNVDEQAWFEIYDDCNKIDL